MRPLALITHPSFATDDPDAWPLGGNRYALQNQLIAADRLLATLPVLPCRPALDPEILRVHTQDFFAQIKAAAAKPQGDLVPDRTLYTGPILQKARLAAGGALLGLELLLAGTYQHVFALVPGGHHAESARSLGLCLLNTEAIAAAGALSAGLSRVAILDLDTHHGNGTQEIFYTHPNVFYCSLHQSGWGHAGTGTPDYQGDGLGLGTTLNLPLPRHTPGPTYLDILESQALPALQAFHPDLLIIFAGYDTHRLDPIGHLDLEAEDYTAIAALLDTFARTLPIPGALWVLGGGYDYQLAAASLLATLSALVTP